MRVFIFLHILTMFAAVAAAYGPALMMVLAVRRRDVAALRSVMSGNALVARLIAPLFMVGVVFGVIAIFTNGFDPLAGWLVIAYVLVVASILSANLITNPWIERVEAAAKESPDDRFSPELARITGSARNNLLLLFDALIIVALIADMVFKPFPDRIL